MLARLGDYHRRDTETALTLGLPLPNGCLQQIAANRFSTPQDVIAILPQGFVRPILSAIPKILVATCAKGYGRTIP
jgi:putative heme iron utilization protein